MKRRLIFLLSFVALALCVAVAWIAFRSAPSIRFVGFAQQTYGHTATFEIVNDSGSSFAVYGYGPGSPFYRCRVSTPTGWEDDLLGWCGTGSGAHTLAPHSVTPMEVGLPRELPGAPFVVGVHFHRGTAAEVEARGLSRFEDFIGWLRSRIDPSYKDRQYTWSSIAQRP